MFSVAAVAAALVAIVALTGCSSGPSANPQVSITKTGFSPAQVTVKAGGTVTWTNQDVTAQTVTARDLSFDSSTVYPHKSYSRTFKTAGTYEYYCRYFPQFVGTVTVQ
jgi:plastocyanin